MSAKKQWDKRLAQGLCGECGKVPVERFKRCQLCREFVNEYRQGWWRGRAKWRINAKRRQQYAELGYRIS